MQFSYLEPTTVSLSLAEDTKTDQAQARAVHGAGLVHTHHTAAISVCTPNAKAQGQTKIVYFTFTGA
jgi:hypothetical protein